MKTWYWFDLKIYSLLFIYYLYTSIFENFAYDGVWNLHGCSLYGGEAHKAKYKKI